jgi:peroxiredoxin
MTRLIWSNDEPSDPQPTTDKSPSREQIYKARALRAGEQAPGFILPDQHGRTVTLSALVAKGPVVLRFCRHCDAPSCFRELGRLAALHLECEKRGATLAVISAQPPHPHPADRDPATYAFLLLADKGAKVARSYGLAYRAPPVGRPPATAEDRYDSLKRRRGRNESAPATYIVDQRSVVVLAFVDLEGRSRMETDQIVMALECLGKRREPKGGARDGADRSDKP